MLTEELRSGGPDAELLRLLARAEFYGHDPDSALAHLVAARVRDPQDLLTALDQAGLLADLGRHREALDLLAGLPAAQRRDPAVRWLRGRTYRGMGLHALAVEAYRPIRTLRWDHRGRARSAWWLTGGPLGSVRNRLLAWDRTAQDTWQAWSTQLAALDTLPLPAGFDPAGIRAGVDRYLRGLALLTVRWLTILRGVRRVAWVLAGFVVWVLLTAVVRGELAWSVPAAMVLAAAGVLLAAGVLRLVERFALRGRFRQATARGVIIGAGLLAAGYGLARLGARAPGWVAVAGAMLLTPVVLALLLGVFIAPVTMIRWYLANRHHRFLPREAVLYLLLRALAGMSVASRRNDLASRSEWLWFLERAATLTARRLPAVLYPFDNLTKAWAAERAGRAAAALRRLKRQVIAPDEGSWDRVTEALRDDAVALATGELARMRTAPPPSPAAVRRSRWHAVLGTLRTLLFMALPLAGVLAVQPLLHLDAPALRWAKVVGLAWAALYLLLTLDPTLREKLETARVLVGTAREAGRPTASGSSGRSGQLGRDLTGDDV